MWPPASAAAMPIGTSSVITATSASKSIPQASSAMRMGSRGARKAVRAALIHQGIGPEARGHLGAARLAHELDMVHVGRAVGPLIGARQRRQAGRFVERLAGDAAVVQQIEDLAQLDARTAASRRAPAARSWRCPARTCSGRDRATPRPAGRRGCRRGGSRVSCGGHSAAFGRGAESPVRASASCRHRA